MKFCTHCGKQLEDEFEFCQFCGTKCPVASEQSEVQSAASDSGEAFSEEKPKTESKEPWYDKVTRTISGFAGGTQAVRPPLKTIFGDIFLKHDSNASSEIFICGTPLTTPTLSENDKVWPRPWLWTRILVAFAAAFALLHLCCDSFGNTNAYPGLMVIGSFMIPIAMLVFFFELNTPKNISFFTTIKYFLVGGCASLAITLLLYDLFSMELNPYLTAALIGIIEEVGKLAIVAFVIWRDKNAKYGVNGLLIGAAIGAGFAAFESAGYAFNIFFTQFLNTLDINASYSEMIDNILLRAILAPGGHVIWAAMSGYAVMLVKGEKQLSMSFLSKKAFWKVFWIPIALHAIWDMPIQFGKTIVGVILPKLLLVALGWVVIFVIIDICLAQIGAILAKIKRDAENAEKESVSEV